MRKFMFFILLLSVGGCASVSIPNYIQDKSPYKEVYYAPFDVVHEAAVKAVEDLGWSISEEADPALFERGRDLNNGSQILLFTQVRQSSFFLGSGYARLNIYLRTTPDKGTEVEIRYLRVTSVIFKNLYNYKGESIAGHIFTRIEQQLNS